MFYEIMASIDSLNSTFKAFNVNSASCLQSSVVKKQNPYIGNVTSPKIAVVDDYFQKTIRIDSDRIPDMVHGVAVEAFIKTGLPNAQITRMSTTYDESSVKNALAYILNGVEKYDAINLSKSSDISYKELSKFIGMKVTPKNVAQYKDEIKKRFFASKHQDAQYLKEIIASLEKIAANGTKIYIAAGNNENKDFNLYTLADGVNVVGATLKYDKIAPYSASNNLVTRYERGSFRIHKVKDENGNLGFDITQNGKPDIMALETTSKVKKAIFDIYGTSFAVPQALTRDFRKTID